MPAASIANAPPLLLHCRRRRLRRQKRLAGAREACPRFHFRFRFHRHCSRHCSRRLGQLGRLNHLGCLALASSGRTRWGYRGIPSRA
eukprot:364543-Chlamydomonas_euryale.AAC.5